MRIVEKLVTICGETQFVGLPCALLRFAGCDLRCAWCDTGYAYVEGEEEPREDLLAWTDATSLELVLLTGGEPLLQAELPLLAEELARRHTVLVETSGACDIRPLAAPVVRSMDIKCPGSGEEARNCWDNLHYLRPGDAVKMVLASREDYEYAVRVTRQYRLAPPIHVLFSAAHSALALSTLAGWILEDRLSQVRLNIQAHRFIWPDLER
jgi:7-carboxy-7-deazaguanine synthase